MASKVAEAYVLFRADMGTFKKDVGSIPAMIKQAISQIGADNLITPATKKIGKALKAQLDSVVQEFAERFRKLVAPDNPMLTRLKSAVEKAIKTTAPELKILVKEFGSKLLEGVKQADKFLRASADYLEKKVRLAAAALGLSFNKAAAAQASATAPSAKKPADSAEEKERKRVAKEVEKEEKRALSERSKEEKRIAKEDEKERKRVAKEIEKEEKRVAKEREKEHKKSSDDKQSRRDSLKGQVANMAGVSGLGELGGGLVGKAGAIGAILASALLAYKAVQQLKQSIKDAMEQAKADFQLKWANKGSGWTGEQLERMNKAFRSDTAFSRKETTQAQTELARKPNIKEDQFKGALKASGDLAAAMGMELPEAARQVGEALDEPLRVAEGSLESVGILLTQHEKQQIRNAVAARDFAGAQELVLKAFGQYKGAAQEMAQGPEGAFKKFESAVEDLRTKLGEKLLPVVTRVVKWLTKAIDWTAAVISDWDGALDIAWMGIKLGFENTLDVISDFFAGVHAVAAGGWDAMVAGGEEAWKQITNIFSGKSSSTSIGAEMEKSFQKGFEGVLSKYHVGQSEKAKALEAKLKQMKHDFAKKHGLLDEQQKGLDGFDEKAGGKKTPHISKTKFQFEFSGMAELHKKIQEQLMPSESVAMERAGLKAAEQAVNVQKNMDEKLGVIARAAVAGGAGAVFSR